VETSRSDRFEALARECLEPLRRYLARRTDPDSAADVLGDTLLVAWRRFDDLPAEPLPWPF
jgi:RNA polymerase sigma-70 factor, ECF subfamily